MEKQIKLVIDPGENENRAFGRNITNLGTFVSLNHDENLAARKIGELSIGHNSSKTSQNSFKPSFSQTKVTTIELKTPEKNPRAENLESDVSTRAATVKKAKKRSLDTAVEGNVVKKRKNCPSHEKFHIKQSQKRLFQRIEEVNKKHFDFYRVEVKIEFTITSKEGEIVESSRSWEDARTENNEES